MNLEIKPSLLICLAVVIFLIPIRWITGWILAVAVHEICHYITLKLMRVDVHSVTAGVTGAYMDTEPIPALKELICAIAGPLGSFALTFLGRWLPCTAVCALLHLIFNMVPVYPLDGGRAVLAFARCVGLEKWEKKIQILLESVVFALLIGVSVCACMKGVGFLPMLFAAVFFFRLHPIKIPCKRSKQIVQ